MMIRVSVAVEVVALVVVVVIRAARWSAMKAMEV